MKKQTTNNNTNSYFNNVDIIGKYKDMPTIDKMDKFDFINVFFLSRYDEIWKRITDKVKSDNMWGIINKMSIVAPHQLMMFKNTLLTPHTLDFLRAYNKSSAVPKWWYLKTEKVSSNGEQLAKLFDIVMIDEFCLRNNVLKKTLFNMFQNHKDIVIKELTDFKKIFDEELNAKNTKKSSLNKKESKSIIDKYKKIKK